MYAAIVLPNIILYYILPVYFCKKGILKCFSLYTAIILPRKSMVEVYYTCILEKV